MALFDWVRPKESTTSKAITDAVGDRFGPRAILRALEEAVPRYINNIDQGKLIYPACKRTLSDPDGDARSVWDHTRLEAIRYVVMVPGREFELLIEPTRQLEMIDAYLVQRPHADTVIDFTGTTSTDFSIAILAGLNWLRHCAQLAEVPLAEQSGTLRKFRRVVTLAQRWWLMEAAERCSHLLASGEKPPLMLYMVWSEYTRLSKQVAAAAVFGPSKDHAAKSSALPADVIPRFEAAQDPIDLSNNDRGFKGSRASSLRVAFEHC
jgi:hypothetical protein